MRTVTATTKAWITPHSTISPKELFNGERLDALALSNSDMEFCGWTLVGEAEITVHLVDERQLIDNKVAALREEAKNIRAEATMRVTQIEEKIQNLLAISYDAEVA